VCYNESIGVYIYILYIIIGPKKHGHFKTPNVSVSNMSLCQGHFCMCVLVMLGERNYFLLKNYSFNFKYVFKEFDSCYFILKIENL